LRVPTGKVNPILIYIAPFGYNGDCFLFCHSHNFSLLYLLQPNSITFLPTPVEI
jgi:hypothetical protein